jgi:hypothetical protein
MGSPKTVDRNAMTFAPIGWNVVLWGVKTPLGGWGKYLVRMAKGSRLANPMRGKRHKIQKGLQKSQSQMEAAKTGATAKEDLLK